MKTAAEVRERLELFQNAKEQFLCPPQEPVSDPSVICVGGDDQCDLHRIVLYSHKDMTTIQLTATLESLNAEIAALTWVLDEIMTLSDAIPVFEAQAKHVAEQGVPK